jgi:hypothetical protein
MDTSVHQTLYAQGLEIRKRVMGEDYVANALEKGSSDFLRPLQQFATVCFCFRFLIHDLPVAVHSLPSYPNSFTCFDIWFQGFEETQG